MRRTLIIAVVSVLAATIATPALAGSPQGPAHIALGDSVTAGSGANSPNTAYPERLHRYLKSTDCNDASAHACPHLELINLSVGGATSTDLIASQLGPAVAEIVARQSDADATNNVEYISITIGGNDLFRPVIEACGGGVDQACVGTITTLFATYQANLTTILGTLRSVAPDAQIAIMTYYNPLGSCQLADLAPLADGVLEGGNGLPFGLNDIIRGVATHVGGVTVVEAYGLVAPTDLVGGEDCLHPDDSGHRKIAKAFAAALR
ncbi:SGNH/GDSL hydrolase family protein [Actinomycetota bacterium]|jgi:lysophospholipase L1-like esterase